MKYVAVFLVKVYRKLISPLKPPCCRFSPTCSAYAQQAFLQRGFVAGLILTIGRVCRCSPFGPGGYDPVPEHGFKRVPLRPSRQGETSSAPAENGEEDVSGSSR